MEEEEEEDPMLLPVCSEIPWHHMEPLVDRILDEQYGPWPGQQKPKEAPKETPKEKPPEHQKVQEGRRPPAAPAGATLPGGAATQDAAAAVDAEAQGTATAGELRAQGNEAFKRKEYVKALSLWDRAAGLAREAEDMDLWATCRANAAQAELRRRQWAEAEACATEVLQRFPRHEKALFRRAAAREALGELEGARRDLTGVIACNFLNREAQNALARVQERLQKRGEGAA